MVLMKYKIVEVTVIVHSKILTIVVKVLFHDVSVSDIYVDVYGSWFII